MQNSLFREKNMKKLSSPEELQDYIRVVNPNVWLVFLAIVFVITACGIWAVFGKLETNIPVSGTVKNGELHVIAHASKRETVERDMEVKVKGETVGKVRQIENLMDGQISITIQTSNLADGKYNVQITTESVQPLSFILQ